MRRALLLLVVLTACASPPETPPPDPTVVARPPVDADSLVPATPPRADANTVALYSLDTADFYTAVTPRPVAPVRIDGSDAAQPAAGSGGGASGAASAASTSAVTSRPPFAFVTSAPTV